MASRGFRWEDVEGADWRELVANLRSVNCPEETVRDILLARINRNFGPLLTAAYGQATVCNYWETPAPLTISNAGRAREIRREIRKMTVDLLGIDPGEEEMRKDEHYSFLPLEKVRQLEEWRDSFGEREMALRAKAGTARAPEDMEEAETIQREKEAALARLFTPEERFEYDLRNSSLAYGLRQTLGAFKPSESEFRAIFAARQSAEKNRVSDSEGAKADLVAKLRSALGEDRYAVYAQVQDPAYVNAAAVATRYELGDDLARQVCDLKQATEQQVKQWQSDGQMTDQQRQTAVEGLRREVEQALASAMGEKAFSLYRTQGGSWLDNLK
jgi:hypothetical protein